MPGVPLPSVLKAPARAFQFDRARLRWPEWVVAGSAVVLLLVTFLMSWYTHTLVSGGTGPKYFVSENVDGWHGVSHLRWLIVITILAGLLLFVLQATRRSPALPVTMSLFVMILGGLTVIWLLFRVVIDPAGGRRPGGWVGLVAAVVLTWGAYRSLRMEGISPTDAPAHIPTVTVAAAKDEAAGPTGQPVPPAEHS